jgi:drug/metabolite transporter (DMT)-like permease
MAESGKREAGAFDIRVFIGALLGMYGVVLLLTAWFGTSEADLAKADGVNVNLWTGIGLVVAAVVFVGWARLRPVVVPAENPSADD